MVQAPSPGDVMKFTIVPANLRDSVTKDIQVLNSEKLIGYNMMLGGEKNAANNMDDAGSDYYNVTVNLVIKRGSAFAAQMAAKEQTTLQINPEKPINTEEVASSSFAAAATLDTTSAAELVDQENYQSRTARAQASSLIATDESDVAVPPSEGFAQFEDDVEQPQDSKLAS